jgi:hypothetical protein
MATLYFNGAINDDWSILQMGSVYNWWVDAGCTTPATGLPTSSDSVVATAAIRHNSYGDPTTVVDFTTDSDLTINITVTGLATFTGYSFVGWNAIPVITGNATFYDTAYFFSGIITGDALFKDISQAYYNGSVYGAATLADSSTNVGSGVVAGILLFTGVEALNKSLISILNASLNPFILGFTPTADVLIVGI